MKFKFLLLTFLLTIVSLGVKAQNLVQIAPSNDTVNCDGFAKIDTTLFTSSSWYWTEDSSTVIAQAVYELTNLCPGEYMLHYSDNSGTSHQYAFYIGIANSTGNPNGGSGGQPNNGKPCQAELDGQPTDSTGLNFILKDKSRVDSGYVVSYELKIDGVVVSTDSVYNAQMTAGDYLFEYTISTSSGCVDTYVDTLTFPHFGDPNGGGTGNDPCSNANLQVQLMPYDATDSVSCDGRIEAIVSGNNQPFTYQWSNGFTGTVNDSLCPGSYDLTVTDTAGCSQTHNVYVSFNGNPNGGSGGQPNNGKPCQAELDGQPTDSTGLNFILKDKSRVDSGYVVSYELKIDGVVVSTDSVYNAQMTAGDYLFEYTISTSSGCVDTYVDTLTFPHFGDPNGGGTGNDPCSNANLQVQLMPYDATDSVSCDGRIEAIVSGNNQPFTYQWSNGFTGTVNDSLCPGSYDLTVTDTAGCSQTHNVYVSFNGNPNGGGTGNDPCSNANLQVQLMPYDATDSVSCDGRIEAIVSGNNQPFTYQWSNGFTGTVNDSLCPGSYDLTVTDTAGCSQTHNVYVSFNGNPNGGSGGQPNNGKPCQAELDGQPTDSTGLNFILKDKSRVDSGYVVSYELKIDGVVVSTDSVYNAQMTAGDYLFEYTISTSSGCVDTYVDTLTFPHFGDPNGGGTGNDPCSNANLQVQLMPYDATDSVSCDGRIEAIVSGNNQPFTYQWSNGFTGTVNDSLCPGSYDLTVTDTAGCSQTHNVYVSFNGNPNGGGTGNDPCSNANLQVQLMPYDATDSVSCDGRIEAIVSGNNQPFTYQWSNGFTGTVNDSLCPGSYDLTVTDTAGCSQTHNVYVSFNGNPNGGSGGQPNNGKPCQAELDGQPTDSTGLNFILKDKSRVDSGYVVSYELKIDGVVVSTDSVYNAQMTAGDYLFEYTISTSSGCVDTYVDTLTFPHFGDPNGGGTGNDPCAANINTTVAFNPTLASDSTSCDAGIYVVVNGGNGPFNYSWSNGMSGQMIDSICPGNYDVTITDNNGCVKTFNTYVGFVKDSTTSTTPCANVNINGVINATPASDSSKCDGILAVTGNGGVGPYTFDWSNGSSSNMIDSLCYGEYSVTVTDKNGCSKLINAKVQVAMVNVNPCANTNLNGIIYHTEASDSTICDGQLEVKGTGGVTPYTYSWDNGSTAKVIDSLCEGFYDVTITDNVGCQRKINAYVGVVNIDPVDPCLNNNLQGDINVLAVTDSVNCNGSVQVYASGGQSPFTFEWNNGITSPTLHNVCAGNYSVTITDKNGCTASAVGTVVEDFVSVVDPCQNTYMNISLIPSPSNDSTNCNGTIVSQVSGGAAPYTYNWNNGEHTADLANICKGKYTLEVLDTNNCKFVASCYVAFADTVTPNQQVDPLDAYVIPQGVSGAGKCDGSASTVVYGGKAPYTFMYSNGSTNPSAFNLCSGIQYVTVVDANNDTLSLNFIIASPDNVITTTTSSTLNDSTVVDSLFNDAISNCNIDFDSIVSAQITTVTFTSQTSVDVIWTITFTDNTTEDILNTYDILDFNDGVYTFTMQVYCPSKAVGQYVTASEKYYLNKSAASLDEVTESQMKVYPNPFDNLIKIELSTTDKAQVIVSDIVGKVLINATFENGKVDLDVNNLPKGQYVLMVKSNNQVRSWNLVK